MKFNEIKKWALDLLYSILISYIAISLVAQAGIYVKEWSDIHKVGFAVIFTIVNFISNQQYTVNVHVEYNDE